MSAPLRAQAFASDVQRMLLELSDSGQQPETKSFIQEVFLQSHQAKVTSFLPFLLSMKQNDQVVAALGVRPAGMATLFLEQYLSRPIENTLAQKLARPIDREKIIEVGNLASKQPGSARTLFVMLNAYLLGAGYEWCVFTATAQVRNIFARTGIVLQTLADAHADNLGSAARDWGTYYQQSPQVVVGDIQQGARQSVRVLLTDPRFVSLIPLWQAAYEAGKQRLLTTQPQHFDVLINPSI